MKGDDDVNTAMKDEEADGSGEKLLGFNSTEEQPSGPGGQDSMWGNEKYESVPLDVKGIDEDNSKGTRDSLYPGSALWKTRQLDERPKDSKLWPYFQDGQRRIDYVLTYHVQKPPSTRKQKSHSCCLRRKRTSSPSREDPELAAQEQRLDYHEDDQRLRREEFEENLCEMGLEMEKDEGNKIPGVGFLKIHAPWEVLCREAEFMKLKMPTIKKYEVSPGSGIAEKVNMFMQKVTAPLQPKVVDSQMENEKHLSYPFSREKQHLFDLSDRNSFFDSKTRSSIGDIDCVHAEPNDRKILYEEWASYSIFYKYQPIGLIRYYPDAECTARGRKYFGEKVGLYFAWLGVYTQMLIPAAVVGVIVFLYGCATVDDNIPSMEICDERNNITMCPMCDRACSYWKLVTACGTARASHLFDNAATVFFAIFMALWATMFMEHWKRRQMRLNYIWDMTGFEDSESHPRAEYEFRVMKKSLKKEQSPKTGNVKLTCTDRMPAYMTIIVMMIFLIFVTLAIVFGVVLYRVSIMTALHMSSTPTFRSNIRATVKTTGAVINLIIIIIMDEVYGAIARWLTIMEVPKTDKSFEERLIFKTFILKFANAFTPIVYLAFFRGRLIGRPGKYIYVMGSYRMEECAHAGCLMELCIQLCITMLGKQLIQNNLFEIGIPKLKKLLRQRKIDKKHQEELNKTLHRHEKDHFLGPFVGLNPEYMEMIIQFGMVTLFVASFPLAPLFALLNNIIEIRLDAKKFVTELRRPIAVRAKDIGIWYTLLRGLSKVAVIVNAFVISFTSDFIPRLVYQYMYSPDGTLHGFVNHTLSYFNVSQFQPGTEPLEPLHLGYRVDVCRYKDYRDPPWSDTPYEFSREFWAILAARFAFVIVFQNVVMLMSDFVDWLIPDIPKDISVQIHKERNLIVELFMKEEQGKKYRNTMSDPSPQPLRSRPSSQA
ncbi:Anoctamin-1 [Anabarilius grahami]|uniref:Anoctamin n=1 Tax=Anabarilius grahami TaxID=495550 RepID=A0A3N0Y553_ANAGA|nr:Anoctamin-1 [Anabarilius grahami]